MDRRVLWAGLETMAGGVREPWLVMGDFNEVRYGWKWVSRVEPRWLRMEEFNNCIEAAGLVEVPTIGEGMTFCNEKSGVHRVESRIDRALCNGDWLAKWPLCKVEHMESGTSDHIAIRFVVGMVVRRISPFRFKNSWTRDEDFYDYIDKC